MSSAATIPVAAPRLFGSVERLRGALLWLTGFAGAIVFMEPSPYEVASLLTIFVFVCTGLALRPALMPLFVLLLLYNTGFSLAVIQVTDETKPITWVAVSWYLSITAVFFAAMLGSNTQERLSLLMRGTTMAAAFASIIAILSYFHLFGRFSDLFLLYDRAHATFNDPNVLGAFLILPAMLALQRILNGRAGDALRASFLLGLLAVAVLLSFSRAAWGQFAFTAALLMFFTFVTSRSSSERMRVALIAIAGIVVVVMMLAALLSIDRVAELFKERASLEQSYDVGHLGRFGRHILGAEIALDRPFGIGPAAVPQDLSRRPAQYLSQRLPVGRLALGPHVSDDDAHHLGPRIALCLCRHTVAADLSRGLLRLRRHGGRKRHHRQRPLAPLLPAARRDLGPDDGFAPYRRRRPRERASDFVAPAGALAPVGRAA